jgi:hypothetical protein
MATLVTDNRTFSEMTPVEDRRRGSDRRKEIRMASKHSPATLSVAARAPMSVEIRDVSRSGLGLITPTLVLTGSSVVIVCGAMIINGTVRHCRETLAGQFSAGVSIDRIVDTGAGREI